MLDEVLYAAYSAHTRYCPGNVRPVVGRVTFTRKLLLPTLVRYPPDPKVVAFTRTVPVGGEVAPVLH